MPDPRILTLDEIKGIATRLATAATSIRGPRSLRTELLLASLLIQTLIRSGVIAGPVTLRGSHDG
jgi:hypothetical protein